MSNIIINIKAFIAAVYLFFIGIAYPNVTPKVEYTTEIEVHPFVYTDDTDEIDCVGYDVIFNIKCKNVGKPFKGKDPYNVIIKIYKGSKDNMKVINSYHSDYHSPTEPAEVPIMKNQKFEYHEFVTFKEKGSSIEPGVYSAMVSVYGNTQYYENAVVIE